MSRRLLSLQNRQRTRILDLRLLRRIACTLLARHLPVASYELGIHLVQAAEMARINQQFLQHAGSTDVITFDHGAEDGAPAGLRPPGKSEPLGPGRPLRLHGELFLCLDDAVAQARTFRTSWQLELVRYLIHGLLHLCGHDDLAAAARRRMKRDEEKLVALIAGSFPVAALGRPAAVARRRPAAAGRSQGSVRPRVGPPQRPRAGTTARTRTARHG